MPMQKQDLLLHAERQWDQSLKFELHTSDMTEYFSRSAVVRTITVEFEVPDDFNTIPAEVAALQRKKAKLQDEYMSNKAEVDKQIKDLLMLGHEAKEVTDE